MNILVVEDNMASARMLCSNILKWRYSVEAAETGKEALKRLGEQQFDVILLDIFLPDGRGHLLIPEMQQLSPHSWIITMTGYNSRQLELEVRKKGIAYYMIKPFRMAEMKAILDHMSRKREEVALNGTTG